MHRQKTLKALTMRKKLFKNKQKIPPSPLFVELIKIMTFLVSLLCVELTTDFASATLALHALVSCGLHGSHPRHHARAGSGSRGEFLSLLKQNCQPEFLPLDYKEGRSRALLFCKVPGYVYEVTYYCSRKVKQLLNVTDRPIFPVLHGFHMDQRS